MAVYCGSYSSLSATMLLLPHRELPAGTLGTGKWRGTRNFGELCGGRCSIPRTPVIAGVSVEGAKEEVFLPSLSPPIRSVNRVTHLSCFCKFIDYSTDPVLLLVKLPHLFWSPSSQLRWHTGSIVYIGEQRHSHYRNSRRNPAETYSDQIET